MTVLRNVLKATSNLRNRLVVNGKKEQNLKKVEQLKSEKDETVKPE